MPKVRAPPTFKERILAKLQFSKEKKDAALPWSKAAEDLTEVAFTDTTYFQKPEGKKLLEVMYRNSWIVKKCINVRANMLSFRGLKIVVKSDKAKQAVDELLRKMHPTRPMLALQNSFRNRSINCDIFGNAFDELLYLPAGTKEKPADPKNAKDLIGFSVIHPVNLDFKRTPSDKIEFKNNIPVGWTFRKDPTSIELVDLHFDRVAHLKYNVIGDELLGMSTIEPIYKTAERLMKIEEGTTQGILTHGNPLHDVIVGDESHPPTKKMIDNVSEEVRGLNAMSEYVHPPWIRVGQIEAFSLGKSPNYMQPFITAICANFEVPEFIALGRGEGCYSADTQTLTEDGWKFYWEIDQDNDKIATYNPETHKLEYHKPKGFSLYKHIGKMFHFKNSVTDIMVTPDHKMFVSSQSDGKNSNNWKLMEAKDIDFGRFHLKNNLTWEGTSKEFIEIPEIKYDPQSRVKDEGNIKIPADEFMEFLGYYISEGSHSGKNKGTYKIEIWQEPGEKHEKMKACLEKLPFKVNFEEKRFRFASKSMYFFLDQVGTCSHNKYIPKWIKESSSDKLQILLDALILGDGTRHSEFNENSTTICYYTTSKQLADDVSEIMLKTGHVVNMRTIEREDRLPLHRVYGNLSWKDSKFLKDDIKEIDYEDMVYCFQVPNHLFITKRNGKIAIQGNTNKATAEAMIHFIHQTIEPLQQAQALYFEEQILAPLMKIKKIDEIPMIEWNEILPSTPAELAVTVSTLSQTLIGEKCVITYEEARELLNLGKDIDFKKPAGTELAEKKGMPGIYLTEPHGKLIWEGKKKLIVKSKEFTSNLMTPLYLVSDKKIYGIIKLREPEKITLEQFDKLHNEHLITEKEREKWWPHADKLYSYKFNILEKFKEPKDYTPPQGVQTFIKEVKL